MVQTKTEVFKLWWPVLATFIPTITALVIWGTSVESRVNSNIEWRKERNGDFRQLIELSAQMHGIRAVVDRVDTKIEKIEERQNNLHQYIIQQVPPRR